MRAWRLHRHGPLAGDSLSLEHLPLPRPAAGELLVRVIACGLCHTEFDEIEGRVRPPALPVTPGHQVVGAVVDEGADCLRGLLGQTVGVAWIVGACGGCRHCRAGNENLCGDFRACGCDRDGGYAEFVAAPEAFVHPLPAALDPVDATPLLCAGAVGLRALRLCGLGEGEDAGLTGFGASGHLVLQMLRHRHPGARVAVFARNSAERALALELGADWAGDTGQQPPWPLAAIIDTTPAWKPVRSALRALAPGGRLVVNAIAKEAGDQDELLHLDYRRDLWREKVLRSVTNVTRQDVRECLQLAVEATLRPRLTRHDFASANQALQAMRSGAHTGAHVLVVGGA